MVASNVKGSPSGPRRITKTTATVDAGACGANATTLATVAVAGLKVTDMVVVLPPTGGLTANLALGAAYCSVAGTLTIPVINPTAAPIAAGSKTYPVLIYRFDA